MATWKRVLGTIVLSVLLLPAAGCGSDTSSPGAVVIEVTDITSPLAVIAATPFTVTGLNFLSVAGSDVTVRFTADGGVTPFDGGTSATTDVPGVAVSNTEVTGTSPVSTFVGSFDAFVTVILPSTASGTSELPIAEFVGVATDAVDDDFDIVGNTHLSRDAANGLLINDNPPGVVSVTDFDAVSINGGAVAVDPDGAFTYAPPAGFEGVDTFTYDIAGGVGTDTATVSVTVAEMVWFIDSSAAGGGDGRQASPFDDIAPFMAIQGGLAEAGDTIFLYDASGMPYNGPLVLQPAQILLGQGVDLVVGGETLIAATVNPLLTGAGGVTLTLANNNTVRGLDIGNTAGAGLEGSALAAFALDTVNVATTGGPAVFIDGAIANATFGTISSADSFNLGVQLTNIAGTLTVSGRTTVTNPTLVGVNVALGTGTVNFNGLEITTTSALGLVTGGPCQVNVTGSGNFVTTTTGAPLVLGGAIGSSGITFESVSCNGAITGIEVVSSGSLGGLTVTGDGSGLKNGSGGTLQNCTGNAISLLATQDVSLSQIDIDGAGSHGIWLSDVTNFVYQDAVIEAAGDADDEFGIALLEVYGDVLIEDVEFDDIYEDGIRLENSTVDDGAADSFVFSRIDILDHLLGGLGENGITVRTLGVADVNVLITGCTFDINAEGLLGVLGASLGTSTLEMTVHDCVFDAVDAFGSGCIQLQSSDTSAATFNVLENDLNLSNSTSIVVNNDDDAVTFATIRDNDIDADPVSNNGFGIQLRQDMNGTFTVLAQDNTVDGHGFDGIRALARDTTDGTGTLNVTLLGNVIGLPALLGSGIHVQADDQNTLCANVSGNSATGWNTLPGTDDDILLAQLGASTFRVTQLAPTLAVDPSEIDDANNNATIGVNGTVNWGPPACPVPPIVP